MDHMEPLETNADRLGRPKTTISGLPLCFF